MWVCVYIFRSVVGKWACVCICGSGLCSLWIFFFFFFCCGGGGGGGVGGGFGCG